VHGVAAPQGVLLTPLLALPLLLNVFFLVQDYVQGSFLIIFYNRRLLHWILIVLVFLENVIR
jgi:hypothetical protein